MTFARTFPATTWILRHLASRTARNIYAAVFSIILVGGITFRIKTAIFEHRALAVIRVLGSFEIGKTTRAEALHKIPGLKQETSADPQIPFRCRGDECLEFEIAESTLGDLATRLFSSWYSPRLSSVMQWWGMRYCRLHVHLIIRSRTVSEFGYGLMISESWITYPGAIFVDAWGREHLEYRHSPPVDDDSSDYRIGHYFKWPELDTEVAFTPATPQVFKNHAFHVNLDCVWSIPGCRVANQILPDVEEDRLRQEALLKSRLRSPNQCPERILVRRARNKSDILLLRVKKVTNECDNQYPRTRFRVVDFDLERVLKGKLDRPLLGVAVYRDMYAPWGGPEELIHNSAYDLLHPGQRLLVFSDVSTNIDSPCEAMAATQTALTTIENELKR